MGWNTASTVYHLQQKKNLRFDESPFFPLISADVCNINKLIRKKNMFQVVVVIAVAVSDTLVKNCKCGARDIVII